MSEITSLQDEEESEEDETKQITNLDDIIDLFLEKSNPSQESLVSELIRFDDLDLPKRLTVEEFTIGERSLQFKALYDPGLEEAINYVPDPPPPYDNDGIQKYVDLTKALNIPVVKRFEQSLTKPSIELQYYGLQSRQMRAMADALTENTSVQILNLEENTLDLDSMYHLRQMLRQNLYIQKLILKGCMFGTEEAEMLGSGLVVCQCLEYLDLSHNALGDDGFEAIAPSFCYNMSLKTLILSHNNLSHKSGFKLADMMEENISIQNLDLSWNEIYLGPGIKKFLSATGSQNSSLLKLNMSWNGLQGGKIAAYFRQFLTSHKAIQMLDISSNRFEGTDTMTKLARGINGSETLHELKLGFNPIREDDAYTLLSVISNNSTLRVLNLEYVWVNKEFDQLCKQAQDRGLKIVVGGVYEGKEIKGPDMQKCLLERARYLGFKPKKKKKRKDFGWFLLRLRNANKLQPVKKSKFVELVEQDKIKFEEGLVDELAKKFRNEKKRIDLAHMLNVYLGLFPNTQLPRPRTRKKRRGKSKSSKMEREIEKTKETTEQDTNKEISEVITTNEVEPMPKFEPPTKYKPSNELMSVELLPVNEFESPVDSVPKTESETLEGISSPEIELQTEHIQRVETIETPAEDTPTQKLNH